MKQLWNDRRGNALVLTAATLPLLHRVGRPCTDTIQWTVWKRQIQRAADGGALAGVRGLVAGQTPLPHARRIRRSAATSRSTIMCCSATTTPTASPRIRRASGPWASDPNAVRVTLSVQRRLGFSSIVPRKPPTITAQATATVVATGEYCVISLENTNATGLTFKAMRPSTWAAEWRRIRAAPGPSTPADQRRSLPLRSRRSAEFRQAAFSPKGRSSSPIRRLRRILTRTSIRPRTFRPPIARTSG
jgi:Flp pilus assembly protein TadG